MCFQCCPLITIFTTGKKKLVYHRWKENQRETSKERWERERERRKFLIEAKLQFSLLNPPPPGSAQVLRLLLYVVSYSSALPVNLFYCLNWFVLGFHHLQLKMLWYSTLPRRSHICAPNTENPECVSQILSGINHLCLTDFSFRNTWMCL